MKFEKNPDNRYRSLPFWSLNGKLNESELIEQIGILKKMGFGGVFIHSRTGLATEYMGSEWLRLARKCADECEKQGIDAWLYDEDRWPSGTCGGYVTEDPRYRSRFISAHIGERDEFDFHTLGVSFLGAFAIKLEGEEYSVSTQDMPRYSGMSIADYFPVSNLWEVPDGYLVMTFEEELMEPDEFYNDFTYADALNKQATERFIELTHEKYRAAMGENFGKSIKGIFTDEPHRGPLFNGFGIKNKNSLRMIPYTEKLFDAYSARWGENLRDKLPELYFKVGQDNFSRTMWRYVEMLQELFINSFAKPYNEWCKKNNLIFTGHILHEDCLSAQTTMSGSVMRFYEHMTYPGMDNLGSDNNCYTAAIAVSSVAKQTGKKFVLSELYGCSGWKTTFEEYKQIGDWHAAFGVNLRCPHLSWYTMKGEAKRDYPASINKQANWHGEYRAVEDYFARLGYVMTNSKPLTSTLVVTPIESAWGLTHMGAYYSGFAVRDSEYAQLEKDFAEFNEGLVYSGVDFDYGDEEMMSRLCKAGSDDCGAYLKVGKMCYRTIILPAMVNIRSTTLALINKFANLGGKVIVGRAYPRYIDGVKAAVSIKGAEVLSVSDAIKAAGSVKLMNIESDGKFFSALRSAGKNEYVCFAVNSSRQNKANARITVKGEYNAEKFDLRSGETVGVKYRHEGGNTVIDYNFDVSEEILLHFTEKKTAAAPEVKAAEEFKLNSGAVEYRLGSPNTLVLDRAECYVNGEYFDTDEILRLDRKLREKFGLRFRGGSMVQPWFKEKFGGGITDKKVCEAELRFEFNADIIPSDARLMAENYGCTAFELNGNNLDGAPEKSKTDECFTLIPVPASAFKSGKNVLKVRFDFSDGYDMENLYLTGSFAVTAGNPSTVKALPEKLNYGDVCTQGLPFYAGDVTYILNCPDGEYEITVNDFYAACLKTDDVVAAFAPFTFKATARGGKLEITAVLTPKNMFGPLHEARALNMTCGPENFHTGGVNWTDDYSFIPQGIFSAPKAVKTK